MITGMVQLLVDSDGSATFNDASSNGFANANNVDLMLVFGSMLWRCFPLIMPALILNKNLVIYFANLSLPNSTKRRHSL